MKLRFLRFFLQESKNVKEIPEVTNFLENNSKFRKFSNKVHFLKSKFWQKLDEEAFPENYKNDKFIDKK